MKSCGIEDLRKARSRFAAGSTEPGRFKGIFCNAQLTPAMMAEFCTLDSEGEALLAAAFRSLGLTARSYDRALKTARTIADLEGAQVIRAEHVAEAVQFRALDKEPLF